MELCNGAFRSAGAFGFNHRSTHITYRAPALDLRANTNQLEKTTPEARSFKLPATPPALTLLAEPKRTLIGQLLENAPSRAESDWSEECLSGGLANGLRTGLPSRGVSAKGVLLFSIGLSEVDLMGATQLFCFIKQNRMNYHTICTKPAGDGVNMVCLKRNSHPHWLTELSRICQSRPH